MRNAATYHGEIIPVNRGVIFKLVFGMSNYWCTGDRQNWGESGLQKDRGLPQKSRWGITKVWMKAKGAAWGWGDRGVTRFRYHQRAWNLSACGGWEAGDDYRSFKIVLIIVIPRIKYFKCLLMSTPVLKGRLKSPSPPPSAGLQPVFRVSQKKARLKSTQMGKD